MCRTLAHTMGKSYTEIEYIDRFVGFICAVSHILSLSPRAHVRVWVLGGMFIFHIFSPFYQRWVCVSVCTSVCAIAVLCWARIAIETHCTPVHSIATKKSDFKHHSVKQWLLAAMEIEWENGDECACFYMAGPTHRIKGKKTNTKWYGNDRRWSCVFCVSFKYTKHRYHLHGTQRWQGIYMHKRAKEITRTHTHTLEHSNTFTGGRTREMCSTYQKAELWTNETVFFLFILRK